jgi:hypothetical protein
MAELDAGWHRMICFGPPGLESREVNVWTRIPQAKGGYVWAVTEINFCPWCGEAVEVCRLK